ncbi:hypothetical protein BC938DRAFT_479420 [Jimgerdemannia flammicorona]|uniref:Tyrosine specific protein phosphatases domain-containing protein n=1 Tax=Jimgerdemannia flammicorona TaxID=994334 RepID=A0A433QKV3_9FUNG|nr:hypothetical protein BC938DRAFT_479420 [Jimgerdemannia flammicorona]
MVGCGKSDVVGGWSAYTMTSLLSDLTALLTTRYRSSSTVLIGHSYGCTLATLLSLTPTLRPSIRALVLLSPKAQFTPAQDRSLRFVRWCPDWIVDAMRLRDRRGGTKSASVDRLVGSEASEEVRRRQLRWNLGSRTRVWRRMIAGVDRWVTKTEWEMVSVPVLLVGGKEDKVVSPHDMYEIRSCLLQNAHATLTATQVPPPFVIPGAGHQTMLEKPELVNPVALNFLNKSCGCEAMDPTWQILHKTRGENKWDLKNYEKWKRMPTISSTTIGPSLFRGMKVMRQTDPDHSPSAFFAKYPEVGYVIDISHDSSPPYRPSDFDRSNVCYVKLGTVSKIPPSRNDVARFIECVKRCWGERPDVQIAVHCHYGFNRTGFVICCYLIEEMAVSVPDAIKCFAAARPPGIRHTHFKDELYLRYALPERSETGDADGE